MYETDKDSRNHIMWNPSESSLKNVEADEAGKLATFRDRFGHGFEVDSDLFGEQGRGVSEADLKAAKAAKEKKAKKPSRRTDV
jgi:hypothetical protein